MIKYSSLCTFFIFLFYLFSFSSLNGQSSFPCAAWDDVAFGTAVGTAIFDDCAETTFDISAMAYQGFGSTTDNQFGVYQKLCGDGEVIIHHTAMTDGLAGIELRASLDGDAAKVAVAGKRSSQNEVLTRTTAGAVETRMMKTAFNRKWYKIVRNTNSFVFYHSSNGTSWFIMSTKTVVMPDCIYLGTFARSNSSVVTANATLENLTITGFTDPVTVATEINFANTEMTVAPDGSAEICVNLNEACHCSSTSVKVRRKNSTPATPHLTDFTAPWTILTFENGSTQECFTLDIGATDTSGFYKLILETPSGGNGAVIGGDNILDLEVDVNYSPVGYCGVKILPPSSEFSSATPDNFDFFDRFGNIYRAADIVANSGGGSCTSGYFELEFFGSAFTAAEITTICDVFTYVSTVFESEHENIPIRLLKSGSLDAEVIAAASSFYRNSLDQNPCGVARPLLWELMNTEYDPSGLLPAGFPYFVGEIDVNPTLGDFDLFSIILHEVGHLLGFASLIGADGNPINGYYSNYDLLLQNENEVTPSILPLIELDPNGNCCNAQQYNQSPDVPSPETPGFYGTCAGTTGEDHTQLIFISGPDISVTVSGDTSFLNADDPIATTEDLNLFAVNYFSHINLVCDNEDYSMHFTFMPNEDRLVYTAKEQDIFCQLGYTLTTPPSGVSCNSVCSVIPIDDGYFNIMATDIINNEFTLSIDDLLSNDIIVGEPNPVFAIQDCSDFLSVTQNSTDVIVSDLLPGNTYTLCYTLTGCNGDQCEEAFIYLYYPAEDVVPLPDCTLCESGENLYEIGDFENFSTDVINGVNSFNNFFPQVEVGNCNLFTINGIQSNTPGIIDEDGSGNNKVLFLGGYVEISGGIIIEPNPEAAFLQLCRPVMPGCDVEVSFQYRIPNGNFPQDKGYIQVFGSEFPPCTLNTAPDCDASSASDWLCLIEEVNGLPAEGVLLDYNNNPPLQWQTFTQTISNPSSGFPIHYVTIANNILSPNIQISGFNEMPVFIDNVSIIPDCGQTATVDATVLSACANGEVVISYDLCLGLNASAITNGDLVAQLPTGLGLAFSATGDFGVNGIADVASLNAGNCTTLELHIDTESSSLAIGDNLSIDVFLDVDDTCTGGENELDILIEEDCNVIESINCPCVGNQILDWNLPQTGMTLTQMAAAGITVPTGQLSGHCVNLSGTLIIDQNYGFIDSEISIAAGSSIVVQQGGALNTDNSHLHGCGKMWEGIHVNTGGQIKIIGTGVRDAQFGVFVEASNSTVQTGGTITESYFIDNYIGVYLDGEGVNDSWFIEENHFVSTGTLLPPYPTQDNLSNALLLPPIVSTAKSLAGIWADDVRTFQPIRNRFEGLAAGIVARNSSLTAYQNYFVNILDENVYVYDPATWDSSLYTDFVNGPEGRAIISSTSEAEVLNVIGGNGAGMFNCTYGVDTKATGLRVLGQQMQNVNYGVYARLITSPGLRIENNTISNAEYGIAMAFNVPAALFSVKNNTITTKANTFSMGIAAHYGMAGDEISELDDNTVYLKGAGVGISVYSFKGLDIHHNTIEMEDAAENIYGARLDFATNCAFRDNTINGDGTTGTLQATENTNVGLFCRMSMGTTFCCNSIDNTFIGAEFAGNSAALHLDATASNNLRETSFGQHHIGLYMQDNSIIGEQVHTGSSWGVAADYSSGSGAVHDGGALGADQSLFISIPQSIPPNPLPAGWFIPQAGGVGTILCNPIECTPLDGFIPDHPEVAKIIANYNNGSTITETRDWEAARYLYGQAMKHGTGNNTDLANFVTANSNTDMNLFFEEEEDMRGALTDLASLSLQKDMVDYEETLNSLLSINLALKALAYEENHALWALKAMTQADLNSQKNSIDNQWTTIQTSRAALATSLINQLTNVSGTADYINGTQEAYTNHIQVFSNAGSLIDASAVPVLQNLANECVDDCGQSVIDARSLLTLAGINGAFTESCSGGVQPLMDTNSQNNAVANQLTVYPIPAKGQLTVLMPVNEGAVGSKNLELLNLEGRLIQEWALSTDLIRYELDVSHLPAGIYFIRLMSEVGEAAIQKIIIH